MPVRLLGGWLSVINSLRSGKLHFHAPIEALIIFNRLGLPIVWYSKSTQTCVGDNPLVRDPYELGTCQVMVQQPDPAR